MRSQLCSLRSSSREAMAASGYLSVPHHSACRTPPPPLLPTLTARRCGMQNGAVLTGIQMPPLPLGLMIVESTTGCAFGTGPLQFVFMGQIDVHLALLELQFHTLDSPRSRDA